MISYLEMKNEQDLFIFPWGTNVSRLGDSTTPESTQDDDDRAIGRLANNDTGNRYSACAIRTLEQQQQQQQQHNNNNTLVATESSSRRNIRWASTDTRS